jgi:hypothetical protein
MLRWAVDGPTEALAATTKIDFLWTSIPTSMTFFAMTCLLAVWLCATGPSRRVTHGVQEAGHFFNSPHSHCDSASAEIIIEPEMVDGQQARA